MWSILFLYRWNILDHIHHQVICMLFSREKFRSMSLTMLGWFTSTLGRSGTRKGWWFWCSRTTMTRCFVATHWVRINFALCTWQSEDGSILRWITSPPVLCKNWERMMILVLQKSRYEPSIHHQVFCKNLLGREKLCSMSLTILGWLTSPLGRGEVGGSGVPDRLSRFSRSFRVGGLSFSLALNEVDRSPPSQLSDSLLL